MPEFGVVIATLVTLLSLDSISIGFVTTQTIHVKLEVNLVVLADAVMLFFEAANALPKFIGVFFGARTLQAISQVVE